MSYVIFERLGISLGLGLLVGLQRQWTKSEIAGIRTFPLITLMGAMVATVEGKSPGWLTAAGLLSVAMMLLTANVLRPRMAMVDPGMTTEVAALLMYVTGSAVGFGFLTPSIAVCGVVVALLQWKQPLHGLVERIGEKEIKSVVTLVLIAMVVLPVVPNEVFGPFNVLNPFRIWLMVVLIVSISLSGYVAHKLLGTRGGAVVGGLLGGLISSTATTVSYARQASTETSETPGTGRMQAMVIMMASTVVIVRVLLEISVVSSGFLRFAVLPFGIQLMAMLIVSLTLYFSSRDEELEPSEFENPAQLRAALIFGLFYAMILFLVAAVTSHFGDRALYVVAFFSGLTDLDAITLSTAEIVQADKLHPDTGWRVILLAMLSNLVFKLGLVALLGPRRLLRRVGIAFLISLTVGGLLLLLLPEGTVVAW